MYIYKIRIATCSWPAVHVCEGSLQVARLSAILYNLFIYFFRKDLLAIVSLIVLFSKVIVGRFLAILSIF